MMVLGIILMLSIAVFGLLRMSLTSGRVASGLQTSTKEIHRIDGALEKGVNLVRNDNTACGGTLALDPPDADYDVECSQLTGGPSGSRTMELRAFPVGETEPLSGKAQVRIIDEVGDQTIVGYNVVVCDWLLGAAMVTEPLKGCS